MCGDRSTSAVVYALRMTSAHRQRWTRWVLCTVASASAWGCAGSGTTTDPDTGAELTSGATLPTPFTADQIREANPPGTTLVFRIEQRDSPPLMRTVQFVDGSDSTAVIEERRRTLEGAVVGTDETYEVAWTRLRDHASFPEARTTVRESSTTVPAGSFRCRLHEVTGGDADGAFPTTVSRFYFAPERPGPPVRYEMETDGEITFRMVLVEDTRG